MSQESIIKFDKVVKRFGSHTVLDHLDFEVNPGEMVTIIGPSGSGKSTLGRAICGLLGDVGGSMTLNGQPLPPTLSRRTREHLQQIQMVHQIPDNALNPRLCIGDQLERAVQTFTGLSRPLRQRRVAELLEQVGLPADTAKRLPHTLSGGQKQRVCIARALAAEPALIICDEPTSALDPLVALDVLALLRRLQTETGVSYLFITHDLHVAREIAHEVAVLHDGRIVRHGRTAEALSAPLDDYTRRLVEAVPQMRQDWLMQMAG